VARLVPLAIRLAWVLLALGVADYALARRRHLKDLMMTREEVKREYKESEGDPHHKAQRKALHRQFAQGGAARGVQKATAVIVNPTHIAVALRYDNKECEAPYLVAKGCEADALALRREAQRRGIPVVRDVPLARSLIHYDIGEQIPEELYQAAAVVLRVAMESRDSDGRPRSQTP
jgi:type III secretion protein U